MTESKKNANYFKNIRKLLPGGTVIFIYGLNIYQKH